MALADVVAAAKALIALQVARDGNTPYATLVKLQVDAQRKVDAAAVELGVQRLTKFQQV